MKKSCKKTSIGGQAVLEGVMMRGKTAMATAVRDADGVIRLEAERLKQNNNKFFKLPLVRGAVSFVNSLYTGTKILSRSASVYGEDEGEPSKIEKWLAKTFKVDAMKVAMTLGVVIGVTAAILIFFFIPSLIGGLFSKYVTDNILLVNLFEGLVRILIFISYILLISLMKDIRRTFMYHGAEHKTITCYESGMDLTVENVKKCRRVHDRCGTTFTFFVMTVSILVFSLFEAIPGVHEAIGQYRILKALCKIALLPVVAGLSYELLKFLSKTNFFLFVPLKLPGLGLQMLTTREPDDQMIEVAITSFNKVLAMDEDPDEPECRFVCPEKLGDTLGKLKKRFNDAGIDETDAEWTVSFVTGKKRGELNADFTLSASSLDKINKIADERLSGRPLWYVLGTAEFYGYEIKVDERVLIPRPETEELVEKAMQSIGKDSRVLDLCTGSGAIAIAVSKKTGAEVVASDISDGALALAEENAEKNDCAITFLKSDMFDSLDGKFDVIISNPPYIKSGDISRLQREVKDFEPEIALDGGEDGLAFYVRIAEGAKNFLNCGGLVFMEIGEGQAEDVRRIFGGYSVEVYKDLNGVDRIVKAGVV